MSSALTEEELQKSAVLSAGDMDYDASEPTAQAEDVDDDSPLVNLEVTVADPADDELSDIRSGDVDLDMEDADDEPQSSVEGELDEGGDDDDIDGGEDEPFDEDAEAEDDDELLPGVASTARHSSVPDDEPDEDEEDAEMEGDDEDEGVGAVKIKPGETDDDTSDNSGFESASEEDSDEAADWEEAANNEEEEESDAAAPDKCIFCKQDEENDPSEEFEAYLACRGCGEHAHQQCARDANAFSSQTTAEKWKCPDCAGENEDEDEDEDEDEVAAPADFALQQDNAAPLGSSSPPLSPSSKRSSAPKLARDLLPSQRGGIKPDSHSVFNQLVLDGDPMDGSRLLRKRKTSSVEVDDQLISPRKRRKTDDLGSPEPDGPANDATGSDAPTRPPSSRTLRLKVSRPSLVTVKKRARNILILGLRVKPGALKQIMEAARTRKRQNAAAGTSRPSRPSTSSRSAAPLTAPFVSSSYSQPFYSFFDKETDELKGKPYGGILTEAEADTSKTLPTNDDRRRFDEAKQKAESQWRERIEAMQAEMIEAPTRRPKKTSGPASQIECIEFGGWEIDTWYAAPYPEEYSRNRVLYICEFCLKYMNSDYVAWRHKLKCPAKHPPGDEIYRHGSVSVFEVDGRKNPVYCQNLCLLAKLFLGSKTLYYDVEPFLFYVLCEYDDYGYHFVGYFSKEKRATSQNNVSCILTLPIHQRKGYGNLLIDFSYLLTRVEEKTGSPEKPLSDMGLVSYRNYWRLILCRYLLDHVPDDKSTKVGLSIRQISDDTGLTPDDVISALEGLRCLVRDPQTELYAFRVDFAYCREYVAKWESKNYVKLNPYALTWTPYVMGRGNAMNFELGPAITAIAPREEDDEPKPVSLPSEVATNGHGLPLQDGADNKPQHALEAMVIESTEGNDKENISVKLVSPAAGAEENPTVNGDSVASSKVEDEQEASPDEANDWAKPYANVPVNRFQVFPTAGAARRLDRPRPSAVRPTVSRTGSSSSRPRRSIGGSSSRRPTSSRPKSTSTSKRKSGGTGRGPGRWPKGTKKSDYGNADSGPGLPPAWIERNRLAALAAAAVKNGTAGGPKDANTKDVVQVQVREPGSSGKGKTTSGDGEVVVHTPRTATKEQTVGDDSNSSSELSESDLKDDGEEDALGEDDD